MILIWLTLIIPPLLLGLFAQAKVKGNFAKYSKVRAESGMTGAQAAAQMLRAANITNVRIERVDGFLSDHYDPRHRVIRLSPAVHDSNSLAAVGVATHEVGHAIQHAESYGPLVIRNLAVPAANFGSGVGFLLLFIGLILNSFGLAIVGLGLFFFVVFFQLVNLPVEFNATNRAKRMMPQLGIVGASQMPGVSAVLGAAALTYVAATLQSIGQLIYFAILVFGNRN